MASGPIAKPSGARRRRNSAPSYDTLPADGPGIDAPAWPLDTATSAETALWIDLWGRPIAAAWHSQGIPPVTVARYVRVLLDNPAIATLTAMETALGLTPAALARLHLKVEDEPADVDQVDDNIKSVALKRGIER